MGKILSKFDHGWPGTISRAVDDVVVSLKNAGNADIPFGAPVFLTDDGDAYQGKEHCCFGGTCASWCPGRNSGHLWILDKGEVRFPHRVYDVAVPDCGRTAGAG